MITFRPGQQLKVFTIERAGYGETDGGTPVDGQPELISSCEGSIARATQRQKEEWRQNNHPISHRIVVRGETVAKATDVFVTESGRKFYVQGTGNPLEVGIFTVYYCEERKRQ